MKESNNFRTIKSGGRFLTISFFLLLIVGIAPYLLDPTELLEFGEVLGGTNMLALIIGLIGAIKIGSIYSVENTESTRNQITPATKSVIIIIILLTLFMFLMLA